MSQFILVRQLNPAETTKAIRLRLVRTYDLPEKGKPNLIKSKECLFHDSEGVFVHGHIPKEFVTQFRSSFIEGQIYSIHNFCPVSNFFRYKTTKNKYMIKFHKNTKVYEQVYANNNGDFPRHMFRLRTFESFLQAGQIGDKEIIDVIGRVVKIYNPMEVNVEGNPCKLIDFLIEDNSLRETETVTKSVSSISRFFGGNIFDDLTSNDINLTTICAIYNKHQDVASGDEAESPITFLGQKLLNPDELQSSNCKRKLMDQFSTTHSMKKTHPVVVKKEKM